MNLQSLAMTSFVLLQATWSVKQSRQLIEQLPTSHVIIHCSEPQEGYYLFSEHAVLALFAQASGGSSVNSVLRLDEQVSTPALTGETDAEQAPDLCVILEDDCLVGFFDASVPPQIQSTRHRNDIGARTTTPDLQLRSLVTEFPQTVRVQECFSLLVFLSASPTSQVGISLPIALPLGTTIDILVQPKCGVVLKEGYGEGSLVVISEEETLPLQFKLQSVTVGLGQIRVFAFHQGQPLGVLTVPVVIQEEPTHTQRLTQTQEQPLVPVRLKQPDLSLIILEHPESGVPTFTVRITASDPALELNLKPFGPIRLRIDPLHYFREFFRDIEGLPLTSSDEKAMAAHHLAAKGEGLFTSLLPDELQLLLWSLRDRIRSVQVQSEDPWIPWELCKLCGQENGRMVEGPFLCEAFAFTRWLPGIPIKPNLQLTNIAIVAPADSGLTSARDEQTYLLSLRDGNRLVERIPATFLELRKALASGSYDGLHFIGHGRFRGLNPNTSSIMHLEQQQTFTPEDLCGIVSNLGVTKPLVFLNACQTGRSSMSLTAIGGWAKQFLKVGAGAFLGTYWSVYDKAAGDFTQIFYHRLLHGVPIGRAVQDARLSIKQSGDPTWLAYTVFADPLATVRGADVPSSL